MEQRCDKIEERVITEKDYIAEKAKVKLYEKIAWAVFFVLVSLCVLSMGFVSNAPALTVICFLLLIPAIALGIVTDRKLHKKIESLNIAVYGEIPDIKKSDLFDLIWHDYKANRLKYSFGSMKIKDIDNVRQKIIFTARYKKKDVQVTINDGSVKFKLGDNKKHGIDMKEADNLSELYIMIRDEIREVVNESIQ